VGGIGRLAVGILGAPFIGYLQETSATRQLETTNPALYQTVTVEKVICWANTRPLIP
jgi:hypothetical protein